MHASLVLDLALVLGVAALTSPLAHRLGQPTVLGYLVAGLVVGPYLPIPLFADVGRVESLAELGVVLVMFAVGLELRIARLLRVLPTAGLTGAVQVGFLFWCGFTFGRVLGWGTVECLFLGACIAISSTMVVSRALGDDVEPELREHVLGVLVVQDVLAIVLIAVMTGVAETGVVEPEELGADLAKLAGVLLAMVVGGRIVVPALVRWVATLASDEVLVVVAVGLCFVFASLAEAMGYSVALGAFVSGVLVAESGLGHRVGHLTGSMKDVFAGIFFVSVGMTVNPLEAVDTLPIALAVTAVVLVAQLVVVSLAGLVSGMGLRRSVTAGLALGQIGEFAFILAAIGVAAGVARGELRTILLTVAVLTAFTTPFAIRAAPRVVSWIDRAFPDALRRTLALHEQWVGSLREGARVAGRTGAIRRAVRALGWDAALLLGLALVTTQLHGRVVPLIAARLAVDTATARTVWLGLGLAASVPILVFAVRSTTVLAASVLAVSASRARMRALRALLLLGLTALVGFPIATVLGATPAGGWGMAAVLATIATLAVIAARSARVVHAEVRSAAERLVAALASPEEPDEEHPPEETEMPNLGRLDRVTVAHGSPACGKTLADLDLRARTGATVIAIHRGDGDEVLPNGREVLHEGDVLVLAGTAEALADGREALGVMGG